MAKIHYPLPFLIYILLCLPTNSACEQGDYAGLRDHMVKEQIIARGIKDPRVIKAMKKVPRHRFVPAKNRVLSYGDYPLPIGKGQTISQPYIVAFMTEALELSAEDRVLEIGTGSGYQAAILAELVKEVYTIEIVPELGRRAQKTLEELKYVNIRVKIGDGYKGWPDMAPFDAVIVTCAPEQIPRALVDQLKEGGQMIIPVGMRRTVQKLVKVTKKDGKIETQAVMNVRFVPMVEGDL
ncbi:protein-L-isoaspartate(D-aspartate) O-methyltransferase [Thermodesulfobacteriota bacterium]